MKCFDVTVIIPTCDRPALFRACLEALARQIEPVQRVIVVNDGGASVDDAIGSVARTMAITVIRTNRIGPTKARNRALECVTSRYAAFLDDDSIASPHWSRACAGVYDRHDSLCAQTGRILRADSPNQGANRHCFIPRYRQKLYDERHALFTDPVYRASMEQRLREQLPASLPGVAGHFSGNNAAIAMDFVMHFGGFDPRFPTLSDREMAYRIMRQKGAICYNPDMIVHHAHDPSLMRALKRCIRAVPYEKKLRSLYPDLDWVERASSNGRKPSFLVPLRTGLTPLERFYQQIFFFVHAFAYRIPVPASADPLAMKKRSEPL